MKSHICFITPGSVFLLEERVFPNLGILKVAQACIDRGHVVEHLDLDGVENFEEVMTLHAKQTEAKWFALTATTPQMPATVRVTAAIRAARPNAKIMIGGPHPTLIAAAAKIEAKRGLQLDAARSTRALAQLREIYDVVVAGDGEDAIERALSIGHGLIDADDPSGALFLSKKRVNEVPAPARHLIDMDSYHYSIDGVRATSLIGQLGCPMPCFFCAGRNSPMLRRARMRSVEQVIAELRDIYTTYGYRAMMWYDDELNVSNKRTIELLTAVIALQKELGVEFRQRGFVKAELLTQEQADLMYQAGFRILLTGFESGSPRILENIQKQATVEDNDRCVAFARAAGLKVKALMSLGHPGESEQTIRETREWLLRIAPDDFDATVLSPYPGSPYSDMAERTGTRVWTFTCPNGDRLHMDEVDYSVDMNPYKGRPGEYLSHVWTDYLTREQMVEQRDALEADVRAALKIPFNPSAPGIRFETSMGLTKLPPNILRTSMPAGR